MKNTLNEKTNKELVDLLNAEMVKGEQYLYRAAIILVEMHTRKIPTPSLNHTALRWFREISNETLSPRFVSMFAGSPAIIRAAIGTPLKDQDAWANGDEIAIAETNAAGKVITAYKPLIRFSNSDISLVFKGKALRSLPEQKKLVRKLATPSASHLSVTPNITATPDGKIRVSRGGTYSVGAFSQAIIDAGFERPRRVKKAKA